MSFTDLQMIDLIQKAIERLHDGIVLQICKMRLCLTHHGSGCICIERMIHHRVGLLSSHIEILGKEVIMRTQDDLYALTRELQQAFHQHGEEIRIEICLRLIPE